MKTNYTENLSDLSIDALKSVKSAIEKFGKDPESPKSILEIMDKLIKMFTQKYRPYKILILKDENGLLSYFITNIARQFHKENAVHCISANTLSQEWLQILPQYKDAIENLHLHIMEPAIQCLQENYFDFCLLYNISQDEILNNAIRVLVPNGILVFVAQDGRVIEQKITLKEKQVVHGQSINLEKGELKVLWQQMAEKLANIETSSKEELSQIVKDLTYLEKLAAKLFCEIEDADLKYKLNQIKEKVLNILYASPAPQIKRDILEIAAQITLDSP